MAKINDIRVLAEETASDVASSPRDWMAYLDTAAKLYRYPFADNLLIHAQRPQATACAELETWNEKMGRWVNRGAKGIVLIDDTGPRQRLRYVFDIEDTHMVRGGRTPYLWKMEERYEGRLLEHLTDAYGLAGHDITGLGDALLAVASEMTEENLEEAMDGLFYEVKGSFLEEMDADSIRVNFRNLMVDSLFYTLARRCGLEPMEYLEAEDFVGITDFNALPVLAFLGNAVCESAETVLRDIGRTVRKFYQEELSQQLAFSQNPVYNNNKKFNTLIRESKEKGELENGTDISSQRRLSVSEPDHRGRTDDHREIRDASEDLSEGTQEELVSEYAADREIEQPPYGDRENSTGEDGSPDGKSPEDLSGTRQRNGSDEVGSPHEQSDSDGRREHLEGIGVQLIEETTEQDLSEAEEEIASALSLPELPTVKQQIRSIEERQAALYAGEISIPSDVVDTIFPQKKQEIEIEGTGRQMNLFDFMKSEPEPVITLKVQPEMQQEPKEEADRTEDTDAGFYESMEEQIDVHVLEAMEKAGTSFDEFSPEQMDVIYSSAENGMDITLLLNPEFSPAQMQLIVDVMERISANERHRFESEIEKLTSVVMTPEEINAQRQERHFPLEDFSDGSEIVQGETEVKGNVVEWKPEKQEGKAERVNFRITDDDLGAGGPKAKFKANMEAIHLLKKLEEENRLATSQEQEVLSRYVGWGGIPNAFDKENSDWAEEYRELYDTLTKEEYEAARASTLNAFYTSPTVIHAMYEALENMGLRNGNILEPSCGVGNFMGLLPESMAGSKMYGVELDSISGRMAKQLYQKNEITVQGFETMEYPESFFDCVIGNVPFGAYKVTDRKYDRYNFMIHDYFLAKSIDLVRPGGVVAVVTSSGTMDKQNPAVREYLANRAELLGAIRLPNNAFMRNANTGVVVDILFFQKRDRISLEKPGWVELGTTPEGYTVNSYFAEHPEMVLGEFATESTQYGKQEVTVKALPDRKLKDQLKEAVCHIQGNIEERELEDSELEDAAVSVPADPNVKNFSFTNIEGKVYYRENSKMNLVELPKVTAERVLGMIEIRNITQKLIELQMDGEGKEKIQKVQEELNKAYDSFTSQYGLISSNANRRAFNQDSSYCLLSSLEILDENGELKRKADIFTKRTIKRAEPVTSVDTASEALAVCIGEKAKVDIPFMAQLMDSSEEAVIEELAGVIFKNPLDGKWETSDEYLSGNVREKLRMAEASAEHDPSFQINAEALRRVQPKELDASEIEVRLGAPWIKAEYINRFMAEIFHTPAYRLGKSINVTYAKINGQWNISGKTQDFGNPLITATYGTGRANAYRLLEDALNLKDTKIYDTVMEDGVEKRILNKKETMLVQQKQEMIKSAFKDWIFKDIRRREDICRTYNELFNSTRPREYDGSHIQFAGMTPEITLMPHQKNAIAHVLYGGNTLLAHCVGAGKTFEMIAAGMESKRLGLAQKNLYVVPNHLTEQWGNDFLRLYPGANILVATKKDFEPANRKKFCSRIATGEYDAVIIGHSQFEKIPLSKERQIETINRQIADITFAIEDMAREEGTRFTVKQMEKTKKTLQEKLKKLNDQTRKDDVVTFEQLGVDRLFVDESHYYKNLFLYTKMRNVAGISQTDAQKSSDMFMKCQYLDEITGGKGVTFATGTPISNSMTELYTIMRYLQYDTIQKMGLGHFDAWAASFGETVTAIELSPEGTGYRAKTRFARFYNLPELISLFKEAADVQTADMLNLPVPEAEYINEVLKPSEIQKEMVSSFADRAEMVRGGVVDAKDDNMLKITNDGRKCALDQRLINDMLPDEEDSKVNRCVKNVFDIWKETSERKSTQLVFCDLSTPKNDGSFNVYDDVREKLVEKGIPREEIRFIHEAGTEAQKAELFAKVRAGDVRVLLGSTPKLGAGTNIQDRLIALHHLDCPWKPSDVGRILRTFKIKKNVEVTDNGKIII